MDFPISPLWSGWAGDDCAAVAGPDGRVCVQRSVAFAAAYGVWRSRRLIRKGIFGNATQNLDFFISVGARPSKLGSRKPFGPFSEYVRICIPSDAAFPVFLFIFCEKKKI